MKILRKLFSNKEDRSKKTTGVLLGTGVGFGASAVGAKLAEGAARDEIVAYPIKLQSKLAKLKMDAADLEGRTEYALSKLEKRRLARLKKEIGVEYGGTVGLRYSAEQHAKRANIELPEKIAKLSKSAKGLNRASKALGGAALATAGAGVGYAAYKHHKNKDKKEEK